MQLFFKYQNAVVSVSVWLFAGASFLDQNFIEQQRSFGLSHGRGKLAL